MMRSIYSAMMLAIISMIVLLNPVRGVMDLQSDDYLALGDEALSNAMNEKAIGLYIQGIDLIEDESLLTILSLETNLATALSSIGNNEEAAKHYQAAISGYSKEIDNISDDKDMKKLAEEITAQASFFLGMVLQDLGEARKAVEAYGYAVVLDPYHWSSLANLGSVLHDELRLHDEALDAYNKAYEILTQTEVEPTDAPEEPRFILGELQYRIGLCLNNDLDRKCAMIDDPNMPVSCKEMATHAFSLAVQYNPENELAKHMLATITADATMKRASNVYIQKLFDDYAHNFEHSLVKDLGYTGYERLRRGFDRAFGGDKVPNFPKVIDAGCGTGLVGEQFRNVSQHLIGVDLSAAILDEAEKARPGLYDERILGDVTEVFRAKKPISLIVAADSYIYFGDLVPLFESMQESLSDDGYVAFTLENVSEESEKTLDVSKPDWRWQLTPSGRFAHRKGYVLSVGTTSGLLLVHYESLDGFRFEQGSEVRGHLFVMKKAEFKKDEL